MLLTEAWAGKRGSRKRKRVASYVNYLEMYTGYIRNSLLRGFPAKYEVLVYNPISAPETSLSRFIQLWNFCVHKANHSICVFMFGLPLYTVAQTRTLTVQPTEAIAFLEDNNTKNPNWANSRMPFPSPPASWSCLVPF